MEYSLKIGGEAGQGVQTIGQMVAQAFSRAGYHVFTHQDYESRIRGGHNFYQLRIADHPITASREPIDLLLALNEESLLRHLPEITPEGRVLFDPAAVGEQESTAAHLPLPLSAMAQESGHRLAVNTVAIGAILGLFGLPWESLDALVRQRFQKKGDAWVTINLQAAQRGYDEARRTCPSCLFVLPPPVAAKPLLSGVDAIGLGALAAGCRLYAAYPMTPATGLLTFLSARADAFGLVVEQTEDELAAVNLALGASFAGVRAMTGTSGGGFCLMVEGLSLAGMTETPIVIALGQRPGPATGFPTRTEQGELLFAAHAGHGEFPRVLLAPGTPEEAFLLTRKAFDLAEKYQIPVILLFDTYLADTTWTIGELDFDSIPLRDYRLRGRAFQDLPSYQRYAWTETGVSPLGVPGEAAHFVVLDSDEHDPDGHITEDAEMRIRMIDKRFRRKEPLIRAEMSPPVLYGDRDPEIVLVGWGSTCGVIRETVDRLRRERPSAMFHFSHLWPLPASPPGGYLDCLRRAQATFCIEHNMTGQLARLIRAEEGFSFSHHIQRIDGRPFTVDALWRSCREHLDRA